MKSYSFRTALAVVAFAALPATAMAQTMASATTDLNIRSGPGPQYPIVGAIGAGEQATVEGCLEGSKWCQVTHDGTQGWSYSDYLTASFQSDTVVLTERPPEAVPLVTYEATSSVSDPVAGELIGRVQADGTIQAIAPPPTPVRTYVTTNTLDPVYLDGEVVVGAGIPEAVEIREVPDFQYRYAYINGQPVLVEPQSRRIVYVMRDY